MLDVFLRTRARRFSQSANSAAARQHVRVELVSRSIESSLQAAQAERAALIRRLEELTARAVVPLGNGTDEYLTRDDLDNRRLCELGQEMLRAERSLEQLANSIAHFEFLRTALKVRFPDFKPLSESL